MAGKLSFSIAINLLTENFKRGTNQVKSAFRSMQAQILTFAAALGAGGIGLSNLMTRFIEVARETSRVTTSLKNVSGSMVQFADNQKFLMEMAQKYGLEINALTGNYAKFTAAASISGMSMEEQRKIFESMSRAVTAFGMSADDSNGVFMALSQMMSKGKISSEELRLQMGERLPIALQAMAKAAGVSVAGLDKLLKQGKLMSADILPKFADALNEMIPNVDTDNLETSVNRLKNMFTELVNNSGIQGTYKSLIDWLTEAIKTAAENIKNIVIGVIALITAAVANGAVKWWASISGTARQLEAVAVRSNSALIAATQQRIAAEIALEKAKVAANNATGVAALAARKQVAQAQITLAAASAAEQVEIENVKAAELKILEAKKVADAKRTAIALATITRNRIAAEIELEAAKTGVITASNTQILAAQQRLATAQKSLAKLTAKEIAAQEAAKVAAAQAASIKSATWWGAACTTMKVAGAKLVASLRTMWSTFVPMAIISAIIGIIGYFKNIYDEAKRVKNIFADYKKELSATGNTTEIAQLRVLQKLYNEATGNKKLQAQYQKRIEGIVGEQIKKEQDINDVIKKRIKLLEATATADFLMQKKVEFEDKNHQLGLKSVKETGVGEKTIKNLASLKNLDKGKYNKMIDMLFEEGKDILEVEGIVREYEENAKVLGDINKRIEDAVGYVIQNDTKTNNTDSNDDPTDKKTELQKLEEKHAQTIRELTARREVEKMSVDEYNKAYDELKKSALIEAKSSSDKKVLDSQYIKDLQKAVDNPKYGSVQAELAKVETEYKKNVKLSKVKLDKKLITEDEYRQSLIDAATSAANAAISIDGIGDTADGFIKKMQGVVGDNLKIETPKLKQRDTTFDYNKTDLDKQSETVDIWIEYRDNLKEKLAEAKDKGSTLAISLQSDLDNAIGNVTDFEKALKIAQVKQDIKDLGKEINAMGWDGIKGAVSSVEGIVSAFERLRDAFDPDSEADGWERLMALWNSMTSVVDGIMSVIQTIENITELTNKLTEAKQAEQVIDGAATASKVTNKATETTAEIAAITAKTTAETTALATQTTASVAASTAKTTADTIAMAAASTAAYAAIPFAGPALAAAQIATMKGMIMAAAIPFAKGGIISHGPTSGDRILARVNAGEMILNGSQQSNLFDAINSGNLGSGKTSGITIGFDKVRGSDIFLSLKNYMKSTGKKL